MKYFDNFCIEIHVHIILPLACVTAFFDEGLLSIILTGCGQVVKMLITLTPHCIFGSNTVNPLYNDTVRPKISCD